MPIPKADTSSERTRLRDTVRNKIRDAILDGTLEPGERLNDDALVAWLQVSRTPVREALGDLAHAGLVEMTPNRHTRVAMPLEHEAIDNIQTLGVLFGAAANLAVPGLSDEARAQLVTMIDTCLVDLAAKDGPALNSHAMKLFAALLDHCPNRVLQKVCRDVMDGLAFRLRLPNIVEVLNWNSLTQSFEDLQSAIKGRDAAQVEQAMRALHSLPVA